MPDPITVASIVSIANLFVLIINAIVGARQAYVSHQLKQDVDYFKRQLDHSIQRLDRIHQLTTDIYYAYFPILTHSQKISVEKRIEYLTILDVKKQELVALVKLQGDKDLISLILMFVDEVTDDPSNIDSGKTYHKQVADLRETSRKLYSTISNIKDNQIKQNNQLN